VAGSQRVRLQPGCSVVVRLEGTVEVGQVGIGVIANDMTTNLAPEVVHTFLGSEAIFELELLDIPRSCDLVVRNAAEKDV
jgi:hypothetical protein